MKMHFVPLTALMLAGCGEQQLQVQTNGVVGSCKANALPGVTVILHKPDGSVLQQHQTGPDGKLDVQWPDEARHVTLAYLDSKQSAQLHSIVDFPGDKPVSLISLYQVHLKRRYKPLVAANQFS